MDEQEWATWQDGYGCGAWFITDFSLLMQCTGLKDTAGTLIYEGDIVESDETYREIALGIINFGIYQQISENDGHLGFYINWIKDDFQLARKDLGFWVKHRNIHMFALPP
jgi:uncharacterized phage protein (TIGR01671 family)